MNRLRRCGILLIFTSACLLHCLDVHGQDARPHRQQYLREYEAANTYLGSDERTREEAIRRFEALKKLDPAAPENLDADYRIAVMWLSDHSYARGERPDYPKFHRKVEEMLQAYPDRTNDIRMVYLCHVLENEILPLAKLEAENRKQFSDEEREAYIQRQLAFLAKGKDRIVTPPDCNLTVGFLTGGALCRLVNIYTKEVYKYGMDIPKQKDAILAALDRVIERLKQDPRTAAFVPEIELQKRHTVDLAAKGLNPNPPEPPDPAMTAPTLGGETGGKRMRPFLLVAVAAIFLLVGIRLLAKRRRRMGAAFTAGALLLAFQCWLAMKPGALDVRLEIAEPSGIPRFDEPVTSGLPLPQAKVKDAMGLRLLDPYGRPTPCQFTTQCRWPDGSLKWVLLDFQTSVPSNGIVHYTLCERGRNPAPPQKVSVSHWAPESTPDPRPAPGHATSMPTPRGVLLDTGPLHIGIATNLPGLIHWVLLDGKPTVCPTNPVQLELADETNVLYHAAVPSRIAVEESGPMRATVLVQGTFLAEDGAAIFGGKVGYDLRVTGYAGKPYVKLALTLKNHGWYGYRNEKRPREWLRIRWLDLLVPVVASAPADAWNARFPDGWMRLAGDTVRLAQWIKYPVRDDRGMDDVQFQPPTSSERSLLTILPRSTPYYMLGRPDWFLAEGEISEGWCDVLIGQDRLVGTAIRRFWQNSPKALSAKPGQLTIELWPEGGFWPRSRDACESKTYQFEGGREKTTEIILAFGPNGPRTKRLTATLNGPLMAEPSPDWVRTTGAVWPMASAGLTAKDPDLREALDRYDRLQRAKVHQEDGDPAGKLGLEFGDVWGKVSIPSLRARCSSVFYGWMNYGDVVWSHGYCSLFYDWPYQMLLHHLRLRDRAMFDVAEDMCRHRYDIDQYHVGNTAEWLGYFQRYEKGEHGHLERQPSNTRRWEHNPAPSHTWNRGLLLHWALTGDPRSLQTARENGEAFRRHFYNQHKLAEKNKLVWTEFRSPGWAIENWLALFEYTGDHKYLDWANEIFTKTLLAMETENGSQGHILKGGRQGAQFTGYILEPVCRLHRLTERRDAADFLKRVLDWHRDKGTRGGTLKEDGIYQPVVFFEDWDLGEQGSTVGVGVSFDFLFADGYAYLYQVFGRSRDLEFARRLFRDSLFYYALGPGALPSARTPLGYHYLGDPLGMGAKLHAWSGRYHQLYISTEETSGAARRKDPRSAEGTRSSGLIERWKAAPQVEDETEMATSDEPTEPSTNSNSAVPQILEDLPQDAP